LFTERAGRVPHAHRVMAKNRLPPGLVLALPRITFILYVCH
jgi:hypothetical protein